MDAFHADQFVLPLPPGHSFPMSKYRLLREAVQADPRGINLQEALPASNGELALAHDPQWIDAVVQGTTSAKQQREIGFPWSPQMVERARRSVGATIAAARCALFGGHATSLYWIGCASAACPWRCQWPVATAETSTPLWPSTCKRCAPRHWLGSAGGCLMSGQNVAHERNRRTPNNCPS